MIFLFNPFVEPFSYFNLQHLPSGRIGIHFDSPRILSPIAIGQDLWCKEMEQTMHTQIKPRESNYLVYNQ